MNVGAAIASPIHTVQLKILVCIGHWSSVKSSDNASLNMICLKLHITV